MGLPVLGFLHRGKHLIPDDRVVRGRIFLLLASPLLLLRGGRALPGSGGRRHGVPRLQDSPDTDGPQLPDSADSPQLRRQR